MTQTAIAKEFTRVTGQWYQGAKHRFRQFCHNDQVHLGYTLDEFRSWIREKAPQLELGGTTQCVYCDQHIALKATSPDHRTPISRGGPATLANLALACRYCNRVKGKLLAHEYHALLKGLASSGFTEASIVDIKHRLATAGELADTARRLRAQAHNGTRKAGTCPSTTSKLNPMPATEDF